MIKRTLFISNPYYLSLKNKQLQVSERGGMVLKTAPVEDIGFLVLDHPQISFSMKLVEELSEYNVATVFCDSKHMPSSMLLPLDAHHIQSELFRAQVAASEPLKKNLWKQTIEAKIKNQARLLDKLDKKSLQLKNIAQTVKSGDSDNREGVCGTYLLDCLAGKGVYPRSLWRTAQQFPELWLYPSALGCGTCLGRVGITGHTRHSSPKPL